MSHLVLAVFHDRDEALAAVNALAREGVPPWSIGFLATNPERFGPRTPSVTAAESPPPYPAVHPLPKVVVPDLGEILVGGPLADALLTGSTTLGEQAIVDAIARWGVDRAVAQVAIEELRHGGIVVTVHDADRHRADLIVRRFHPLELT